MGSHLLPQRTRVHERATHSTAPAACSSRGHLTPTSLQQNAQSRQTGKNSDLLLYFAFAVERRYWTGASCIRSPGRAIYRQLALPAAGRLETRFGLLATIDPRRRTSSLYPSWATTGKSEQYPVPTASFSCFAARPWAGCARHGEPEHNRLIAQSPLARAPFRQRRSDPRAMWRTATKR